MVCAVELGLIRPPKIIARPVRKRKSGFSARRVATVVKPAGESTRDSAGETTLPTEKRGVNSWLTHDRLLGEISSEEDRRNRRSLMEHRYSLPPIIATTTRENCTNVAETIFRNAEKIGRKTDVHKSSNPQRSSTEDSHIFNGKFCSHNFDKKPMTNGTRKRFFEKRVTRSPDEKPEDRQDDAETSISIGEIPQKLRNFHLEQESSSTSGKNAGNLDDVESLDDEDSSTPELPRLSSNPDIYEANRAVKNQTGPVDAITTDDDDEVSERDVRGSPNFPSWKKMYLEPWERVKPPVVRKVAGKRRRRFRRVEFQEDRKKVRNVGKIRGSTSSPKDEEAVDGSKKENRNFDRIRSSTSSPEAEETVGSSLEAGVKLTGPAIESEGSEIDETLLVDPSTDLPGALLESDDQTARNVDLNHRFDVDLDMNFEAQRLTTLHDSRGDNEDSSKISSSEDEKSSADELATRKSFLNRWRPKNYRENPKKVQKKNSSLRVKKRRSADSLVIRSSSLDDKENQNRYRQIDDNSIDKKKLQPEVGRITRGSLKNITEKVTNDPTWPVGSVVWGKCSGWWPGIVVAAEDVGMPETPGKSWIFWIAEHRISHLRDRTQIQSFSSGLRMRMIETLRVKSARDAGYSACLATAKLLNDLILHRGPLTRPHHAWVEKHLATRDDLDNWTLLPYPTSVQTRLDELRKANFPATEKYLQEQKENAERSSRSSSSVQKVAARSIAPENPGNLPLSDQKPGVITWAKIMGQTWWPAMIIDFRDCGMKPPNFACQWILWYGDYTLSQVNHRFFLDFETGMRRMKERAATSKREIYRRGVVDAARDYCSRLGYRTEDWSMQDAFDWFSRLDDDDEMWTRCRSMLPGIPGNPESIQKYPQRIVEGLRKHKGNCTVAAIREHNIRDSDALRSVAKEKLDLVHMCLMCLRSNKKRDEKWTQHPFFVGSLCPDCSEKYTPTIFAYGDDGKCFFCTVCAGSDTVVMCDEEDCPRVYCTACLKYLVAPQTYDDIMMTDPFHCFLCVNSPELLAGGLLKPRDDWKTRVAGLFRGNRDSVPSHVENYYKDGKKKLRVLSLFDGISAGLVVLEKLGIHVDAYYASEISPDAEMVSSAHFGERIVRLGDVRFITEEKIREIAPIHLLIGGSPCNDLSLVNPMRRGLHDPNGTGVLVFEYRRVRNLVERANGDQHFFWMFENVASMPTKYRLEINEILGREPDLIDAAHYSPQHRPRLYWSNLPVVSYPLSSQDLQDVLTKNCNRHALVKKIRTVTTRVNSLKQGKEALKPILMNEENDTLWITELEEIFGFPRHYTDVKNLCATKRQKLIGKSWSVQTIAELMRPLCNFFESRGQTS